MEYNKKEISNRAAKILKKQDLKSKNERSLQLYYFSTCFLVLQVYQRIEAYQKKEFQYINANKLLQ